MTGEENQGVGVTMENAIKYFKTHCKIFCDDYMKKIPENSIAYQATLTEKGFYDLAIKAIEQESCEDAVSRQAVIAVVKDWWEKGVIAIDDIHNLPSVTPTRKKGKWIPCSERLPKADEYNGDVAKYYLVQNEYGDMLAARYTHSNYWEQIYQLKPISDEIVAWMSLPEPYKAEMESEE